MYTTKSCCILISSFDGYNDAWEPFFHLLFKYWKDCPYEIYFVSNTISFKNPLVHNILIGKDLGYATNLINVLKQINHKYFIYFQEDYFLDKPVQTGFVSRLINIAEELDVACLRLYPSPGPDMPCMHYPDLLGEISKNAKYRLSLQTAIWNKEEFEKLLVSGETGWEMEFYGSLRSLKVKKPFLSLKRDSNEEIGNIPISYLATGIVKGKWKKRAIDFLKNEGIFIDHKKRGVYKKPFRSKVLFDKIIYKFSKIFKFCT